MSDSGSPAGGGQPGGGAGGSPSSAVKLGATRWWFAAVPAGTFLVGLLLGWLVTSAGGDSDGGLVATETVSVTMSPTETADTQVRVPSECVEAAETAQEATQLILDNLTAFQDFRGDRIIEVLDQLEELSRESRDLAEGCREVEVSPAEDESPADESPTDESTDEATDEESPTEDASPTP